MTQEAFTEWLVCPNCEHKSPYSPIKAKTLEEDAERITKQARAALAQPEQEPVGQLLEDAFGRGQVMWFNKPKDESMLYTTPPQRKPLTDEEINQIADDFIVNYRIPAGSHYDFARAIEAAHGIKENT